MVFTTSKNWRTATKDEKKKVDDLKKKLNDAQADAEAAKKELEDAKSRFAASSKGLESKVSSLEDRIKRPGAYTAASGQLVTAKANAKSTLGGSRSEAARRRLLRQQKSAVEKQANEFKLHQAELNDKIRELERQLETATKNNTDLRERSRQVLRFVARTRAVR